MKQLTLCDYAAKLLVEGYAWSQEVKTKTAADLLGISDSQLNAAKRQGKLPDQVFCESGKLEAKFIRRNCWKVGFKLTLEK